MSNKILKSYWLNLFYFFVIFLGASIVLGFVGEEEGGGLDLTRGFGIASMLSVFYLGHLVASKFSNSQKLDEKIKRSGLTPKEFREKYKEVLDI